MSPTGSCRPSRDCPPCCPQPRRPKSPSPRCSPITRTCSSVMSVALNIADLFEHSVDAAPAKPALKAGGRVMTFAELESDANRLAHFLSARGVRPGEHVALYAKNSIEHVIGLLAILKIRAVAINVSYRYLE